MVGNEKVGNGMEWRKENKESIMECTQNEIDNGMEKGSESRTENAMKWRMKWNG